MTERKLRKKPPKRSRGLVITPPAPRPVEADDPARRIFREAREQQEAASVSPATQSGHAKLVSQALPEARHVSQASPATQTRLQEPASDLLASLPNVAGYLRLSNQIVDHLLPQLEPYEQIIYLQLFRLSHGNGKSFCLISMPKLARRTRISERSAWRAVAELTRKGLVRREASVHGKGKEQGISFWVAIPASPAAQTSHDTQSGHDSQALNKRNTLKNTHNTEEAPAAGVRVGSRFTIEECRRYAKHLQSTGQGINNPGGYATTIKRTGEADELIAAFLNPAAPSKAVDSSQCPDCQGSGFYYPNGIGGGVAKCKHERLKEEKSPA
jgi:hypothetical protein